MEGLAQKAEALRCNEGLSENTGRGVDFQPQHALSAISPNLSTDKLLPTRFPVPIEAPQVLPPAPAAPSLPSSSAELAVGNTQPNVTGIRSACTSSAAGRSPSVDAKRQRALLDIERIRAENVIEVHELGIHVDSRRRIVGKAGGGGKRSKISGFSRQSAQRLRIFCVENFIPERETWALSLTLHNRCTPDEWRAIMKRYRNMLLYHGIGGVWRVELQKRKVPHLHCIMWLPGEIRCAQVVMTWMKATKQVNDKAAFHGCHAQLIKDEGWLVYCSLHNAKLSQTGWQGKQWGVWNKQLFQKRPGLRYTLDDARHAIFLRRLRAYSRKAGGRKTRYMSKGHNFRRVIKGSTVEQLLRGLEASVEPIEKKG